MAAYRFLAPFTGSGSDPTRAFEDGRERGGGVGGDEQRAALGGGFDGEDGGAGGLPDAPLAADEREEAQCSSPSNDASMPVTFMSFGEIAADSPPRWRSLISRMRARMSASRSSNSCLGHLAQLDLHLRREQALAQHAVVVHLRFDRRHDLVEDEADAGDDEGIDDQHGVGAVREPP